MWSKFGGSSDNSLFGTQVHYIEAKEQEFLATYILYYTTKQ